jgi:hypothetical protein
MNVQTYLAIVGALLGLFLFIFPLLAYRKGIMDGVTLRSENKITPLGESFSFRKPSENVANDLETKAVVEGFNNIMAYDGRPQGVSVDG